MAFKPSVSKGPFAWWPTKKGQTAAFLPPLPPRRSVNAAGEITFFKASKGYCIVAMSARGVTRPGP